MNTTSNLTSKHERVVRLSDAVAMSTGYGIAATDQQRLDLLTALKEMVDAYEQVGGEIQMAVSKAARFTGAATASSLAQAIDQAKQQIDAASKAALRARQAAADRVYQGRA